MFKPNFENKLTDKVDIGSVLLHLLDRYNDVEVRGLGCFSLKHIDQYLGSGKGLLLPPAERIVVKPSGQSVNEFFSCAHKEGLITKKDEKALRKSIQRTTNQVLNYGKSELGNIGRLVKPERGEMFLESFQRDNPHTHYLPVLEMISIDRELPQNTQDDASQALDEVEKPEDPHSGWTSYILPLLGIILFTIIIVMVLKRMFTSEKVLSQTKERSELSRSLPEDSSMPPEGEIFSSPSLEKYRHLLTQENIENGCIIIVASLKEATHIKEGLNRIEDLGFEPYSEFNGPFTRIGLRFDCMAYDLSHVLNRVRSEIEAEAWYLSPRISDDQLLVTPEINL